eukprot:2420865-Alexandrium_andersonii.AAC.1
MSPGADTGAIASKSTSASTGTSPDTSVPCLVQSQRGAHGADKIDTVDCVGSVCACVEVCAQSLNHSVTNSFFPQLFVLQRLLPKAAQVGQS